MAVNFTKLRRQEAAKKAILDYHRLVPKSFLTCGTLLGLVRDGHVVPHDSDVDFGTLAWPFKPMPKRFGPFKFWRYFHHKKRVSEVTYHHDNGIKVDLFMFFLDEDERYFAAWPDEFPKRKTVIRRFPKELFDTIVHVEAYGKQLRSISQPELFLELNYGPNWRKPDPKWDYRRRPQRALA